MYCQCTNKRHYRYTTTVLHDKQLNCRICGREFRKEVHSINLDVHNLRLMQSALAYTVNNQTPTDSNDWSRRREMMDMIARIRRMIEDE